MARNIIEEHVVLLNFDVNEKSKKIMLASLNEVNKKINAATLRMINDTDKGLRNLQKKSRELNFHDTLHSLHHLRFYGAFAFGVLSAGIGKLIQSQSELYYQSQRMNLPMEAMEEYGYVVSMLGGNYDQARKSLGKFKQTLQDISLGKNVEALEVFGRLGLTAFDTNGKIKTVTSAIGELKQALNKLDTVEQQTHYLKKLGFDEKEFLYFLTNTDKLSESFQKFYRVIAQAKPETFLQEVGKNSARTVAEFNKLKMVVGLYAKIFSNDFTKDMTPRLEKLVDYLTNNRDNIVGTLEAINSAFVFTIDVGGRIGKTIVTITNSLISLYDGLSRGEKIFLVFTASLYTFSKVLRGQFLTSYFGRLIAGLSMLMLLYEDYLYYKRAMEGENVGYHINWSFTDNLKDGYDSAKDFFSMLGDIPIINDTLENLSKIIERFPLIEDSIDTLKNLFANHKDVLLFAGAILVLTNNFKLLNSALKKSPHLLAMFAAIQGAIFLYEKYKEGELGFPNLFESNGSTPITPREHFMLNSDSETPMMFSNDLFYKLNYPRERMVNMPSLSPFINSNESNSNATTSNIINVEGGIIIEGENAKTIQGIFNEEFVGPSLNTRELP